MDISPVHSPVHANASAVTASTSASSALPKAEVDPSAGIQPASFFTPPTVGGAFNNFLDKFKNKDEVAIIAQLGEQADLSHINDIPRGADRREAAWKAIQATARETQGPMRDLLEGLRENKSVKDYQAWDLGNTFEISTSSKNWQEVYDAIKETGSTSLLMAFKGPFILAEQSTDVTTLGRHSKPDQSDTDAGAHASEQTHASDQTSLEADEKINDGPLDPETFVFSPEGVAWNAVQIGADKAWADGITGKGIRVGVMDTGVDRKHPMLRHAVGDAKDATRWYADSAKTGDKQGHGTHVAGTIAGRDPKNKRHSGVAPDAELMVAPMDQSMIGPFQWFLAPGKAGEAGDARKGADIINNSWGAEGPASRLIKMLDVPLEQLRQAGTTVVFAAGNSGPKRGTINAPGDRESVLTVGATQRDGTIASFSSRAADDKSKPDISAPGAAVPSTVPVSNVGNMLPTARLMNIITGDSIKQQAEQKPVRGTRGAMWQMSGTSMAAPTTSGAIALLLQRFPTLLPDQVKQVLKDSAIDMGPEGFDGVYGAGRLDLTAAFAAAQKLVDTEG